jgi:bacillithiol biosynthesis cysteine-adding enzyme BshC
MSCSNKFLYQKTGFFSQLVTDYLEQKPDLQKFYHHFPSPKGFENQLALKESFSLQKRKVLVKSLKRQYQATQIDLGQTSVLQNIEELENSNTFTITTGHQLNLFTGPLYFLYKIISTLNLAKQLREQHPQKRFVPVYWMASEDHDLEEVNFINFYGGKLRWQNNNKGAVGHLPTQSLERVLDELENRLGPGENAQEWLTQLRQAYLGQKNMAQATRALVHGLFADEGLVILDGDEPSLKRLMQSIFKDDLLQHSAYQNVQETSGALSQNYFEQVHPRKINLFYLKPGSRQRIERKGNRWLVLNTDLSFTETEILTELEENPQRFSPNVVLRPLYQECVLPNLAYIGGGGELAYWLQLKAMFNHFKVPFPIILLRNSVLWVSQKWQNRLADVGLEPTDLFTKLPQLKNRLAKKTAPVDPELQEYEERLLDIFKDLEEVAHLTDDSMLGAVNAQRQKQLKGLKNLKKKLLRAEKRKNHTLMEKTERISNALFPGSSLQERHDNLSIYYASYGKNFINTLKKELNPLDFRFTIICDKAD